MVKMQLISCEQPTIAMLIGLKWAWMTGRGRERVKKVARQMWKFMHRAARRSWPGKGRARRGRCPSTSPRRQTPGWWWCRPGQRRSHRRRPPGSRTERPRTARNRPPCPRSRTIPAAAAKAWKHPANTHVYRRAANMVTTFKLVGKWCGWISVSSTLLLLTKGMHESKTRTFPAQTVKAQTVNCCCFARVEHLWPKDENDCNLHICVRLSHDDTIRALLH